MSVLLVDDDPSMLVTTAFCLEKAGFQVITADDGLHAIDLMERHPRHFTALVTDFHMPLGITGAHLVMYMRPKYPSIPMIITTAITYVVTDRWLHRYGADRLARPYKPETLISMLTVALSN